MANNMTVTTTTSDISCPDCNNIYGIDVKLKKLSYLYKYTYSKIISIPGGTNSDGSAAAPTSTTISINIEIPLDIYQCPSCKTIYDSDIHLTDTEQSASSKYNNYMSQYNLEKRG